MISATSSSRNGAQRDFERREMQYIKEGVVMNGMCLAFHQMMVVQKNHHQKNCVLAIFRSGKMDARTTMGPATIYNIRTVLDLSDPKSTEFLKELITNLRRKE